MPTSVIMERVGWSRGRTVFFERVAVLRPLFVPPDPASRTEYGPGQLAQCDLWFPPVDVPVGFDLYVPFRLGVLDLLAVAAFPLLISWWAARFPARRAAAVDPVKALRAE